MVVQGLLYTNDHEWAKVTGDSATMGVTDYAQNMMGEITFAELPAVGKTVEQRGELAVIESSKSASDVYSPVKGTVTEVNTALKDNPELINDDCYGKGWICKLMITDAGSLKNLMDAKAYEKYLEGL
jgi:glycine cleavage system H protein